MRVPLLLVLSLVGLSSTSSLAGSQRSGGEASAAEPPDAIFVNGDIYTEGSPARVQALAVRRGHIVALGTNDEIRKLKTSHTQVIDLGGHFVMPGFNDAHVHLQEAGLQMLSVNLVGTKSLAEMQQRVAAGTKTAAPGEWVIGGGWDQTLWADQRLPTRQDLDAVTDGHPAVFSRVDGHIAVANTAALKAADITARTPNPQGGQIDRDVNGDPTGIVRETARRDLEAQIPKPTPALLRRAAELALSDAARWGITSAQDNSSWEMFLVYEDLEREGKLPVRISEWLAFNDRVDLLEKHRAAHPGDDPMLHTAMLKGYMDGSLGSRTAALLAPYSDDPGNSGLPRFEQGELNKLTVERMAAGFQIGFHAIGDRAAAMALEAFAQGERYVQEQKLRPDADQPKNFRLRIEHDQVIAPDQFAEYQRLGVIASVQPSHLLTDLNWAMERIGPERAKTSYPWRQFADDGIPIAFGTDYPVEPITPFRGIYAAVTRKNEAGTKEYFPQEKLTIEQALAAYTAGSAYAQFAEKEKGTLAAGMLADFVVLDRDLTKIAPPEILKAHVLSTVVGGKRVYQAPY